MVSDRDRHYRMARCLGKAASHSDNLPLRLKCTARKLPAIVVSYWARKYWKEAILRYMSSWYIIQPAADRVRIDSVISVPAASSSSTESLPSIWSR